MEFVRLPDGSLRPAAPPRYQELTRTDEQGRFVFRGVPAESRGEVFAKHGIWGVTRKRDEQPVQFWSTIVIYTMLSAALFFIF